MNFWKLFFTSLLGTIFGVVILFFIFFIGILSSSGEPEPYIRSNSVLTISLSGDIPSRSSSDPFQDLFQTGSTQPVSLEMLQANLEKAAADDNITGIWLQMNLLSSSWSNLESARDYLMTFKESGKFIYASTDDIGLNEKSYYLATAADSLFLPPMTGFEFNGFLIQTMFLSDLFEKAGVEPEIFQAGDYKSAAERYLLNENSPETIEQLTPILNQAMSTFTDAVEQKTGRTADEINALMGEIPTDPVQWAFDNNLADVIAYPEDVKEQVKQRSGIDEETSLRTVGIRRYNRVSPGSAGLEQPDTRDRIAILYASGNIMPKIPGAFPGNEATITSEGIESSLESILENDDIKAIVLHIESPGGAPTTSDLIWNHIQNASEKKPVVAYMGGVAASGGYYIAMGADTVIASPNTITGSIGVVGQLFNAGELLNEKLGIQFDELRTHEHADMYSMSRGLTPTERAGIERWIDNTYEQFLNRVAENRNLTRDEVDRWAQGRVWTGVDAAEIGLVDLVGNLDDALRVAAEMAEINQYRTVTYPEKKDFLELLFSTAEVRINNWIQSWIPYSNEIRLATDTARRQQSFGWMVLPVDFVIE
ncbi:MAG: signal peptide peptidase SppA [Balneolaceae bacterium]